MSLKTFLQFTRIQTLPAALLPPLAGIAYSLWRFNSFHWLPSLLFFIGLTSINLFVSAWNNVMDYKKAIDPEYKKWNIIAKANIDEKLAVKICLGFLGIDLLIGLLVLALTNLAILPIGGACLLVAVFYTYGPFAFSRFPLGEVLAGLCEGMAGFFLAVYINSFDLGYFFIKFEGMNMVWNWNLAELIPIVIVGLVPFCQNFNVMLSDNLCDLEQDVKNHRFTLPFYLKKKYSLYLYQLVYALPGICIIIGVVFGFLPAWSLLTLLILFKVIPNMQKFLEKQVKSETFHLQIENLILYNGVLALTIFLGDFLKL